MAEYTPMMQQYLKTKEEYKDCILFYRLGDFYEMFFDDAITASRELELTLTGKSCGVEERAPMCGVPYHAVDTYLNRLIKKGYKVAICEQVEDPAMAKGIVKREVTRIVTPGTNIDELTLDEGSNNYISCIYKSLNGFGVAFCDITTADFFVTDCNAYEKLLDEIFKFSPVEIIYNSNLDETIIDTIDSRINAALNSLDNSYFDDRLCERILLNHFKVSSLEAIGLLDFNNGVKAAGSLLQYLYDTQKSELSHLTRITPYIDKAYMLLDSSTRRNLELTVTMREKEKKGSLLWVLDKTKTAMGARTLKSYVEQPLCNIDEIIKRQDAIEELKNSVINREEIREYLGPIYDIERLLTKISYQTANPRDLLSFKQSIYMLPHIKSVLSEFKCNLLSSINEDIDDLSDLYQLIDEAIMEEPPLSSRDGDIIKGSYNAEVYRLRNAKHDGKQWLANLEEKEREATGIKNLRVKYNKVFGYYFEVTNSYANLVPDYFIRKQTLANAERFYTPELKELEDTILNSSDRLNALEYELFREIRDKIFAQVSRIQRTAKAIAGLDALASLAYVAETNHYVKPEINNRGVIDIKEGRHPVVEKMIPAEQFVSNDTYLDNDNSYVSIITGPNMAGKSTYMRQVALIVLMAQIGSFIPAKSAVIGVVDRIFTRVGASDDLATGQSTFMVEMNEVSNILKNATRKSLLILDEIGRGTSTYDGLSIAWSVVEYISDKDKIGAKTLFATHYHELTELEGQLPGVHNYCIAVAENGDDIIFLRKIIKGGADQSYGIQVARLAGLPEAVLSRAKDIVVALNDKDITSVSERIEIQQSLAKPIDTVDPIRLTLRDVDVTNITPLEAMNMLYTLHERALKDE